jgi:hypothetical protein
MQHEARRLLQTPPVPWAQEPKSFVIFEFHNAKSVHASQPQRVGGGSAIRVLIFSRQLLLYRAARATVVLSRENIPHATFLRAEDASSTPASSLAFIAATQHQVDAGTVMLLFTPACLSSRCWFLGDL